MSSDCLSFTARSGLSLGFGAFYEDLFSAALGLVNVHFPGRYL